MSLVYGRVGVILILISTMQACSMQPAPPRPESGFGVIYASFDLECGGKTYSIGTGNNKGECQKASDGKYGLCSDGAGNEARVNCQDGCVTTKGSGTCSVKSE